MTNQYKPYHINQPQQQQWYANPQNQQAPQQYQTQVQTGYQQQSSPVSQINQMISAGLPILVLIGILWIGMMFRPNKNNNGGSGFFTFLAVAVLCGFGLYVWSELKAFL